MKSPVPPRLAGRYATWLDRHRIAIFALSIVLTLVGGFLASKLSLRSDLSTLLPPSKRSVQDLDVLKQRARSFGNVLIMLDTPSPEDRTRAGAELEKKLRALPTELVGSISFDDNTAARYGWANRFLFVDLADLKDAKVALAERLTRARLEANPLFIDIDDDSTAAKASSTHLDDLQHRLDEAERAASAPPVRLSPDGKSQLVMLNVTFPSSDIAKGRLLMGKVRQIGNELEIAYPGTVVEFAGSVNISIFEHDSVISGMAVAASLTIALVFLGLFAYYRRMLPVLGALWALLVGVGFTLGFTYLTIGHLNLLSAFLTAIVIGNGINPGLILLARFFDELRGDEIREGLEPADAIGPAILGSLHGTLAASLTAAVAYGALIVTDFRGFRHFGIIGGVGMLACWITAYTVLPVVLTWLARRNLIGSVREPAIGRLVARLTPRRVGPVLIAGILVTLISTVAVVVYVASDPFEKDWRGLQADGSEIRAQHEVDARMRARFDRKVLGSFSYQLAIAVDQREEVRTIVASLRSIEAARAKGKELFVDIKSIDDVVPIDQDKKLPILAEIRTLLSDPAIAELPEEDRAKLLRFMPPADLRPLTDKDVPEDLLRPFVEQSGKVGRLIYVKGSPRFQTWNVDDRRVFAAEVRRLPLPSYAVIAGEPLVIADIVESMEHDSPMMIIVALLGSILVVWLTVGLRRHGVITLICGISGVVVMIAACAAIGLKVHFLDLIALPITIGLGIDYSVNLVARDREEGGRRSSRYLLATTGGAVLMCSYTTTVGYGSLILSSNGGVRAFGIAAILGEIACIAMALLLAPALLVWWRDRNQAAGTAD